MTSPFVPELPDGCDILSAALAYASAGWYVLPIDPTGKHPGSVLGKGWPQQTSRDPRQVAAWFVGTGYGLALHVGRSGALVFDVDRPELVPEVLRVAIDEGQPPHQSTRIDRPGRGHYVFAAAAGRFGNSGGALGADWGEVRGLNGIIVVAPTPHQRTAEGGRYAWIRTGRLPAVPQAVAATLRPPSGTLTAGDPQVADFLATLPPGEPCRAVDAVTLTMPSAGRHSAMNERTLRLVRLGDQGHRGVPDALGQLRAAFIAAVAPDRRGNVLEAATEFDRGLRGAVGEVLAHPTPAADRGCCLDLDLPDVTFDWGGGVGGAGGEWDDEFWSSREYLKLIRETARRRLVSPWATLGAVLAVTCSQVGPHVVLPGIVGGPASLNLFVALVGGSGAGKDAALSVAKELVPPGPAVPQHEVGTGQGIDSAYTTHTKEAGSVQHCDAALFTATEIDTLAAHGAMTGATVMATLRKVYSGSDLGARYADRAKRRPVRAHHYRAALIAGVQPARSGVLLSDADGGTPQRWLWLPTNDPGADGWHPSDVFEPIVTAIWQPHPEWAADGELGDGMPVSPKPRMTINVCLPAYRAIVQARKDRLLAGLGDDAGRDGHALLTRLKVAALLGLLDDRAEASIEDWDLADWVMRASEFVQAFCVQALATARKAVNRSKALAEVERDDIARDHAEQRIAAALLRILHRRGDWTARSDLRRRLPARDREHFAAAFDRLRAAGQIEDQQSDYGVRHRART